MAHVLTSIRLHQALHGYADGHRLLASSTVLKPRDLKTMLVMSDASGPGAVIGEGGYLTGYPLADSGIYAFACTWAATEMSRPGCVWTHTLLIDFADLALLQSMSAFQAIFLRPGDPPALQHYERQIALKGELHSPRESLPNGELLRRLLWTLYEHPKAKVISLGEEKAAADATLSLWAQQWPRLRRTFRFCTLSFGDRSSEGSTFDLQFVPKRDRSLRLRFADSTDTEKQEPLDSQWLNEAIADLSQGTGGSLRSFLREVGGDITGGREAFAPLCQLFHLSSQAEDPNALNQMIELLENRFDAQSASSLRAFVILASLKNLEWAGEGRVIDFLLEHIDALDSETVNSASLRIGRSLWSRDPQLLVELLHQPAPRGSVAQLTLSAMSCDQVMDGVSRQPGTVLEVLKLRPDLLTAKALWQLPGAWIREAIVWASHQPDQGDAIVRALIFAERSDLALDVTHAFGRARLLGVIASTFGQGHSADSLVGWLSACLADPNIVATTLSADSTFPTTFLTAVARWTYPDFVPNDYGDDPWWTAVRRMTDDADETAKQYLSAYLVVRALGYRSRSQANLLEYAFDSVYLPALHSGLSAEAWNILDRRLPNSWFFDWDKCRRMRDAVVEVFVNRDLSASSFARITRDDDQFNELAELAGRSGHGRRFLRKVAQSLKTSSSTSPRLLVIEEILA